LGEQTTTIEVQLTTPENNSHSNFLLPASEELLYDSSVSLFRGSP
jgi:hypothetical protein